MLGSLYSGLPIDENRVCVPVQRVEVAVGSRTLLSGMTERTMRLDAVLENGSQRVAVVDVDGEQFEVEDGDTFATTLRVIAIEQDALIVSHSDKWCPVRAVGVVEDPNDGSILAMASYPSFDPGAFVDGLTQSQWESLGTINAFTNFAIQGQYAPASTFKVVSYVLALEESIYPLDRPTGDRTIGDGDPAADPTAEDGETDETVPEGEETPPTTQPPSDEELQPLTSDTELYNCTGSLRFRFNDGSSQVYRDWKRNGHGPLDLHGALQASCDLYFWEIALRVWNERSDETGINNEDLWQEWARQFGFGTETGIDLPFEKPGLIPDRQWFREEQRKGTGRVRSTGPWVGGDLMNAVVGQGTVLVTPLQLSNGFSAMVNGGTLWEPRVVSEIVNQDGEVTDENEKADPRHDRPRSRHRSGNPDGSPAGCQRPDRHGAQRLRYVRAGCHECGWQDRDGRDHQSRRSRPRGRHRLVRRGCTRRIAGLRRHGGHRAWRFGWRSRRTGSPAGAAVPRQRRDRS